MTAPHDRQPDLAMTSAFLDALGGPSSPFTFQTFEDSASKSPGLARIFHGTLEQHASTLAKLNAQGAGIFVTISLTDLQGRKSHNVVALRALFIDVDGPAPATYPLPPSILCTSGGGPHAYWLLSPGQPLNEFSPAQKQLATFYGSDPKVHDLPRVMRLPGFWHLKGPPTLVTCTLAPNRYTIAEVLAAHPVAAPLPPARRSSFSGEMPSLSDRVYRASRYLEKIPGAVDGQGGSSPTWSAALALCRGLCLPFDAAVELLTLEYNPRCTPPWKPEELEHKVKGAIEDARVPWGYLLTDSRPAAPQVLRPFRSSAQPAPAPEPQAPPDPRKIVEAAIAAGVKAQELAPLIAAVHDDITRDELISQVSHLRKVGKGVLTGEVKRYRRRNRRGLRAVDPADPAPDRPTILVQAGRLHELVLEAEAALLSSPGPQVYQRSGSLVRVIRTESLSIRGLERPQGALLICPLDAAYLQGRMTGAATWLKEDARRADLVTCDAPVRIAEVLLSSHGDWKAPALIGTIEAPTLRPDGSILETPGYDSSTGLLYDPGETVFPTIPESPSPSDAQAALRTLLQLVGGFPFVDPTDRSGAIAAMLTALVRKSLPSAPLFAFSAPKMRSGKSLLADVGAMLATGRPCAVLSQAGDPEEERKRLLALLLAGDSVICLDNIEHPLGGAVLCQILTQEAIQDRVLGVSKMATAPTSVTVYATGNNLIVEGDLTSRVVPILLDPAMERPEERAFGLNLYTHIPRHRGELVKAALTILRAYIAAGRPAQPIRPWGGFDAWSSLVRASLVWVGLPDPAAGRSRAEELDPVRSGLKAFLVAWFDAVGSRGLTLSDLVRESEADGRSALRETLNEVCPQKNGTYNVRALGKYLKTYVNRIEGGYRLVQLGQDRNHSAVWGVSEVHSPQFTPKSAGSAGSTGSVPAHTLKVSGLSMCDTLDGPAETFPAIPALPADPENAKVTVPEGYTPPFECPDCLCTRSRPSAGTGRPLCVMCWPSPQEAP